MSVRESAREPGKKSVKKIEQKATDSHIEIETTATTTTEKK